MTRIVLDATGGDHGLQPNLEGVAEVLQNDGLDPSRLVLVGPREEVLDNLGQVGVQTDVVEVVDAPDRLNGESPIDALRKKPRNAVSTGVGLVRGGTAGAFVSAGSTGLVVASAMMQLSRLPNVRRPGIAATIRTDHGPVTVIDVGANPEPRADDLLRYAVMAAAHSRSALGIEKPRVGLMNIGSEDEKGNPLTRQTRSLLGEAADEGAFQFAGNIEGVDVFAGACDVIVCDGFTGNVLLKVSEGCAEFVLRNALKVMGEIGASGEMQQDVAQRLRTRIDYAEYGGALLLGVEGLVTICHGRSKGPAIANALRFTARSVESAVIDSIRESVDLSPGDAGEKAGAGEMG